jgi:sucrose-6-phosphate hydrolase SacC (GH32 family)
VLGVFHDPVAGVFRTYHGGAHGFMYSHISTDLQNWDFAPSSYTIPPQPRYSQQRDPYVFWNDAEGTYWAIMTCKVRDVPDGRNGAVCFASSTNLQVWRGRGDLYFPGTIGEPEVPQVFRIRDKWYLLASIYANGRVGKPSYWVSDSPSGPWATMIPNSLDGSDLCAANVGFDGFRWLLFGWIPLTDVESHGYYTWGGHLALPREVYQLGDGGLGTRLERSVGMRVRGERLYPGNSPSVIAQVGFWTLSDNMIYAQAADYVRATLPGVYDRFDIECQLRPDPGNKRLGLIIANLGGSAGIEVALDIEHGRLVIQAEPDAGEPKIFSELPIRLAAHPHHFRIIVEEDIVECFVDDRYSLAARVSKKLAGVILHLFAREGSAAFAGLKVYKLNGLDHRS